jgi:hypothetical protein
MRGGRVCDVDGMFATRAQVDVHRLIGLGRLAVGTSHVRNLEARLLLKLHIPAFVVESDGLFAMEKLVIQIWCQLDDVVGGLCPGRGDEQKKEKKCRAHVDQSIQPPLA